MPLLPSVIRQAVRTHQATVIFLHGLGDSGEGWAPVGDQLRQHLPNVKFIFPHAPEQPVTLNMGLKMPSWYDIISLGDFSRQDEAGLLQSANQVKELIQQEIDSGIPPEKIVVGGFSQGCVVSLLTGLTYREKLAGVLGLSGYLPIHDKFFSLTTEANKNTPIFFGHGDSDEVVNPRFSQMSIQLLKEKGYNVEHRIYEGMGHSCCNQEIIDMAIFLNKVLGFEE